MSCCIATSSGDGILDDALYRSGLSSVPEAEANRFAADILMPCHLVSREMRAGADSVEELTKRFGVSPCAMSIRLGVPAETRGKTSRD